MTRCISARNSLSYVVVADPTKVNTRQRCYEAFKDTLGLEKAQKVLEKYRMLQVVREGQGQTNSQRKSEFRKHAAKLVEQVGVIF